MSEQRAGCPMPDPLTTTATTARNPDTIFVSALLLAAGLGLLATGADPGSVDALVPAWMATGWAAILTAGAGLTLAGVLWREHLAGLLIEAVGRLLLGPASLAYAVAVTAAAGVSGGTVAGLLIALSLSSGWRVFQIARTVHTLRDSIDTLTERRAEQ